MNPLMLPFSVLVNFLMLIVTTQCRRRSRTRGRGTGRAGAGIDGAIDTFGSGVASFLKSVKDGTLWDEEFEEYDEKKGSRAVNDSKHFESIGTSTAFKIGTTVVALLLVGGILYYIWVVKPNMNQRNEELEAKRKRLERMKHYETTKCIAENGVHPDKAFGRLQTIKYKNKSQ